MDQPLLGEEERPKTFSQKMKGMMTPAVLKMAFYTFMYVLSGVVNSIYLKKVMNNLNNYPFFLNQVTNYGYIPIFGAVVLYELKFTKLITKEQRDFPWWKFFTMGALDAINGYIVVIGGVGTSGTMQQLLNQAIIPVTMIGSFIFLKERYSLIQIGGSLLIVGGVILSLLPSLTNAGGNSGNIPFFNMFFLCQAIPFAASNLYKDIAFKSVDMDVWYLQFWDVAYQSVIGTFLFPVNTILPSPANIHWKDMIPDMKNGGICLSGTNIVTPLNSACGQDSSHPCDDCYHAWLTLLIYMTVNVIYNVFILLVIKHGSATVLSIAQTIRLPLTSIAFSQSWIMQNQREKLYNSTLYGLFIIIAGLSAFRAGSLMKKPADGDAVPAKIIPRLGPGGTEIFSESVRSTPLIIPKTPHQHRHQYFTKLGIVQ